ncbi:DUF3347 domain-containing protein [Sinomicrobium weinanense]|uniref:DUF3347 domain-containing protein n=1 Tax=Sinomicrobium weinanense TaxID=2842200 RepID=A0A926Q2J8_9FLAO|nr:DUF3347 domain-containing protein [Sinomicrobium weinanense]MBC9795924.1 DUF3347 domain-containing protein [Sinomicrobium weinanense]MBU3124697.1 DUF3347 domain-containing protein [Sinomicrobium weinanense]
MKNRFVMAVLALGLIAGVLSCKDAKKETVKTVEKNHEDHSGHEEAAQNKEATADLTFKNDKISSAYGHYIHVKTALVNTDAKEAKSGAGMLVKALSEVENATKATDLAKTIEATDDVEKQREAFFGLSEEIVKVIDGQIASGAVYKQYCPMAFDFEGAYWLSSEEEIRNPYFGNKMLKCGEVKETLN